MTNNTEEQQETAMNFIYQPSVTLKTLERGYILEAIRHCKGNKRKAAAALGITVKTIYNKFRGWGGLDQHPEFHSVKGRPRKDSNGTI